MPEGDRYGQLAEFIYKNLGGDLRWLYPRIIERLAADRTEKTGIVRTAALGAVGRKLAEYLEQDPEKLVPLAELWKISVENLQQLVFGVATGREIRIMSIFALSELFDIFPDRVTGFVNTILDYISDWETCDQLALRVIKKMLLRDRDEAQKILLSWARNKNPWIRRLPVATVAFYVKEPDADMDFCRRIIDILSGDNEKIVRKAVVWARNEMKKAGVR